MTKIGVAIASICLASFVSVIGFLFVLLAPVGVFELIGGRQAVEGAPGQAQLFVQWCGPMASATAFFVAILLAFRFYRRLGKAAALISD